jgi:prepilin-type N-terminal cleavage/methylation domain-containing protein
MVKRIRESDEGFSLVELLLVLALLGLVLSLGFTAYALGTKMYSRSD